jgi:hypothetical protein
VAVEKQKQKADSSSDCFPDLIDECLKTVKRVCCIGVVDSDSDSYTEEFARCGLSGCRVAEKCGYGEVDTDPIPELCFKDIGAGNGPE